MSVFLRWNSIVISFGVRGVWIAHKSVERNLFGQGKCESIVDSGVDVVKDIQSCIQAASRGLVAISGKK
jgi:hypothetical protein